MSTEPEVEETNPRTIQGRGTIEAYISKVGMIVLKQENHTDDDSIISMSASDVPTIIQWLNELVLEQNEWALNQARIANN